MNHLLTRSATWVCTFLLCLSMISCSGSPSPQISPPKSQTDPISITANPQTRANNPPSWLSGLNISVDLIPKQTLASTTLDIFKPEYWLVWSHNTLGAIAKAKSSTQVTLDPGSLPVGQHDITVTAFRAPLLIRDKAIRGQRNIYTISKIISIYSP